MRKLTWFLVGLLGLSSILFAIPSNNAQAACRNYSEDEAAVDFNDSEDTRELDVIFEELDSKAEEIPFEEIADEYYQHIENEKAYDAFVEEFGNDVIPPDDESEIDLSCSGGYPGGWLGVRNSATRVPGKNIKQYEKKGGYAQAMRDFNKIEGKLKKIVTDKGTVFVKINSKGNVTLYPVARTGGVPTLNYKEKEKIRYK